jgi:hypothetical protein
MRTALLAGLAAALSACTVYNPPSYPAASQARSDAAPSLPPDCREYTATADIGGRTQTLVGTACPQPDGTWRPVQ